MASRFCAIGSTLSITGCSLAGEPLAGHDPVRVEWLSRIAPGTQPCATTGGDSMPTETKIYDLRIIGGATAKASHKTVALVDNHRELGGAGINTGTVPSKTLRETALALSGIKARKLTGVDLSLKYEATLADFLRHEQHVKAGFNAMVSHQLKADKADVYFGTGVFVDAHTVRVQPGHVRQAVDQPAASDGEVLLHGESILIATGSS